MNLIKIMLSLGRPYCIMKHRNNYRKSLLQGRDIKKHRLKKKKDNIGGNKINHVNEALSITIKYGIFGVLWIILTDIALSFAPDHSFACTYLQTAKEAGCMLQLP